MMMTGVFLRTSKTMITLAIFLAVRWRESMPAFRVRLSCRLQLAANNRRCRAELASGGGASRRSGSGGATRFQSRRTKLSLCFCAYLRTRPHLVTPLCRVCIRHEELHGNSITRRTKCNMSFRDTLV